MRADPLLETLDAAEFERYRLSTLNRESVRMRAEGWDVQFREDHLVCLRREEGTRAPLTMILLCVVCAVFVAVALLQSVEEFGLAIELPADNIVVGAAAVVGLLAGLAAAKRSGGSGPLHRVVISLDRHGRPVSVEQPVR